MLTKLGVIDLDYSGERERVKKFTPTLLLQPSTCFLQVEQRI